MSHWTSIRGTITVQLPFSSVSKKRIVSYIEWAINDARHRGFDITGSENPVKFFVNPPISPSMFSSESGDSFDYGYIMLIGSLRDREDEETIAETHKFLRKLQQYMKLDSICIRISGDYKTPIEGVSPKYDNYDLDDDKSEQLYDKLRRIRKYNSQRFFDRTTDLKKCCEIAETLFNLSPRGLEGLLNNFGLDRLIDWDYTDRYQKWYSGQFGADLPEPNFERAEEWAHKKVFPEKPAIRHVYEEVEELAYGHSQYDYSKEDHEKLSIIYDGLRELLAKEKTEKDTGNEK